MDRPNIEYNHPTDKAWAWVIVFAAGVANFVVNGGTRTIGLLIVELSEFFQAGATMSMVVTAFLAAGFAVFACIGNILGIRFTMRKVAVAGAICSVLGMFMTALAPNMITVILTLGMLSGMGYGFLFGPTMVLVGQYCPKRMSIANGLAVSGGSIGQLVLPFFIVGVMKEYMFRGGILMYAGLIMHCIPAMLLLRPPSFYGIKKNRSETQNVLEDGSQDNNNMTSLQAINQQTADNHAMPYNQSQYYQGPPSYSLRDGTIHEIPSNGYRRASSPFFNPPLNYRRPSGIDGRDLQRLDPELYRRASIAVPHTREEVAEELNVPVEAVTAKITAKVFFRRCCDPVLLKNPVFIIYVLGLSLGHSGFIGACTCAAPYVSFLFGSKSAGATVIFVMGIGDLLGRFGGGFVAQMGFFKKSSLVGGSFVISGFLAMILPFFGKNMWAVLAFGGLFGLLGGTYMAQLVAMADDLFGSALLASSIGLSTMVMGLFAIPIIPTLGRLAARPPPMLPDYGVSVRCAGVIVVIGGILFYLIPLLGWLKRRKMARGGANTGEQNQPEQQTNGLQQNSGSMEATNTRSQPGYSDSLTKTDPGQQYGRPQYYGNNQDSIPSNTIHNPPQSNYYSSPKHSPRDGPYQPMNQGAFTPSQLLNSPNQGGVFQYPPGDFYQGNSMTRSGQQQDFRSQFAGPGGPDRWSKQDFRWSKIPNSQESNL